ncbi:hypothetical protein Ccrd_014734 [Cynara cardunculus var. scolymus]|uniref:Uncharacterized protein n=1 Tax=Cynara cardunculus var. scolymus TaxID=59895 RepID=A0A103YD52_CYNCS|nr:hypothetical protein Ccrd_014734 [Cynara cardunculus var. scolymus]
MGSRALLLLAPAFLADRILVNHFSISGFRQAFRPKEEMLRVGVRNYSVHSSLERPNVSRLAETARISLTPQEAEEFAPKIQQVMHKTMEDVTVFLQTSRGLGNFKMWIFKVLNQQYVQGFRGD